MVSKKEIEDECNKKITELQKELDELELQHKSYISEDQQDNQRYEKYKKLSRQLENLRNQCYLGNWGDYEHWYHSRVPQQFIFNEEDLREIKKALNILKDEKSNEIKEKEEYKKLSKLQDEVTFSKFSEKHKELHKKIEDIQNSIKWNENRIKSIQTKGGLIKLTKDLAEYKRRDEANKIRGEKIQKYKEMIKKAVKK